MVMMHVYLEAKPAKDGKMDFGGVMAGYSQCFRHKPARTPVQVVLPAASRGGLAEIDLVGFVSAIADGSAFDVAGANRCEWMPQVSLPLARPGG